MSASTRPITDEQRESARRWLDEHVDIIRATKGWLTVKTAEKPQPQYLVYAVHGLEMAYELPDAETVHTVLNIQAFAYASGALYDEIIKRIRFEQPMFSTVKWEEMTDNLRLLVFGGLCTYDLESVQHYLPDNEGLLNAETFAGLIRFTAPIDVVRFL